MLARSLFLLLVLPLATASAQAWQSVSQGSTTPVARQSLTLAYDSNRQCTVLFGGCDANSNPRGDTWEWNGSLWLQRQPVTNPPARYGHAMTYDSARQRVVMFGGRDTSQAELADTWEWDGTDWLQATTATAPLARIHSAMAFDSSRQCTVLFGGHSPATMFGDTWEWDGSTWYLRATAGAPARHAHAMVYDQKAQLTLLFGGSPLPGSQMNDLWSWNGVLWSQIPTTNTPSVRQHHTLTYDTVHHLTLLQGGCYLGGGLRDDSWLWNGTDWILLGGPRVTPPRAMAAMTYDAARGRMFLFGGRDGAVGIPSEHVLGDAWECAPAPASFQVTGPGCPGSNGTPTLDAAPLSLPRIGQSFVVHLAQLYNQAATVVVGCLGGPQVPPLNLTPFGMPNCLLHVVPYQNTFLFAYSGQVDWTIPIPPAPFLVGQTAHLQALVVDPAAGNQLEAVVTNGGAATIGW